METEALFNSIRPGHTELNGRVAIITGSNAGIGKGIAIRLAREGMKVVINGRNPKTAEDTARELQKLGAEALPLAADISNTEGIKKLVDETLAAFGTVDLLVNNAADTRRVPFFQVEESVMDSEIASNFKGPYLLSRRTAEIMKEKGRGVIIHISSVGGLRAHNPGLPYDATKAALDAMTRGMGIELARYGIRVNGIAPGAIHTHAGTPLDDPDLKNYVELIPIKRKGFPIEIGAVTAFLASDDAAYIVGQTIYVDGGISSQLSPPRHPI